MNNLKNFRLTCYRITLTARERIQMPPYAGSTLRGGFGQVFRKMVCTQGPIDCRDCTLKAVCPYPYIFETAPFENATQLRTYADVPRPFVLAPLETRGNYQPGESLQFLLTLIGRAIDYLPYFMVSFRELGEIGIGRGRGRFELTQVIADGGPPDGAEIYTSKTQMVQNVDNAICFDKIRQEAASLPTHQLTMRFLTPTRITHEGRLTDKLPFHLFWRRLIGRISALSYFHCGESLQMDFKGLIDQAMTVETVNNNLRWHDWTRYSLRQDRRMKLGGLVGSVTYAGDLKPFTPFIALGQYVHVGKNCTFGLGKYRVENTGE